VSDANEEAALHVQARMKAQGLCGAFYIDGFGEHVMCILRAPCANHGPEHVDAPYRAAALAAVEEREGVDPLIADTVASVIGADDAEIARIVRAVMEKWPTSKPFAQFGHAGAVMYAMALIIDMNAEEAALSIDGFSWHGSEMGDWTMTLRREPATTPATEPEMPTPVHRRRIEREDAVAEKVLWATEPATPEEGTERAPTPDHLRALAEWFDNPNKSESMVVVLAGSNRSLTPGFLLRRIADVLAATSASPSPAGEKRIANSSPDASPEPAPLGDNRGVGPIISEKVGSPAGERREGDAT